MSVDVVVPVAGESVTEGELASWYKQNGEMVAIDEIIAEIETDKASLEIRAPIAGQLEVNVEAGTTVNVGQTIAKITAGKGAPTSAPSTPATPSAPVSNKMEANLSESAKPTPPETATPHSSGSATVHATPGARKLLQEAGMSVEEAASRLGLSGAGDRMSEEQVREILTQGKSATATSPASSPTNSSSERNPLAEMEVLGIDRGETRKKISRMRSTIAKRLVLSQQTGALLTTFNEIDMHAIAEVRKKYKENFKKKYDVGLGYMSFFTKAVALALTEFPVINSQMSESEIIEPHYIDIGVAVSTPKGLVVPVLKNADKLNFESIEAKIKDFAIRGRDNKLSLSELSGGTFSITNGGVFGSMLSTPIVNYPQSAILGMHNIVDRAVAVNGEVVVHPVMYVALSYDHRLIDGAEAVRFLYRIKEMIEDPMRLLIQI